MRTRALTLVITVAVLAAVGMTDASWSWAAGNTASGGCGASGYPWGYNISCQSGGGSPASPGRPGTVSDPGGGGGVVNTPCALYPIAGNATHMLRVCPLPNPNGGLRYAVNRPGATSTIVPAGGGAGGAPPVTPRELLAWARSELALPLPDARTAPPRGSDGLVGLPEWFWADPAQWHPMSARVAVGGVWAQVTARPSGLAIQPGTGASLACPGPGTPYNPRLAASAQHSTCSYTYPQSSDGLPGNAYQVGVTVTWDASWQGSGGAGGALPPLARTAAFPLPVAEAQALNPGS
jgi:hypothetical protein